MDKMGERHKIDRILNLSGLLCPNPSMITAQRLERMKRGETLEVLCSDKSVKSSIPTLCRKENYEIVETREEKGLIHFIIKK
jgi:tRNA 2-thiouridine synthesizing protein A